MSQLSHSTKVKEKKKKRKENCAELKWYARLKKKKEKTYKKTICMILPGSINGNTLLLEHSAPRMDFLRDTPDL